MTRFPFLSAMCMSICLAGSLASANDTSLYAEALPADVSFVRFFGYDDQDSAEFAGFTFDLIAEDANKYLPVAAAHLDNVEAGTFVSILRDEKGTQIIVPEAPRSRQSKVSLLLVNGSDGPLALRLADGSVPVIETVVPAASALREVNPVAITLGVFAADQDAPIATFDVALRRGQNVSFVADGDGVRMIENQFAPLAK